MKYFVALFAFLTAFLYSSVAVSAAASVSTSVITSVQINGKNVITSKMTGEYIDSFMADIVIQPSGVIHVSESIAYHFDVPRHGIIRTIPYIKTNAQGKKFILSIDNVDVTDEKGKKYTFETTKVDEEVSIKIGDADKTMVGAHVYTISYDVHGALTYFSGHDELYWNIIGNQWKIPIRAARATVTLPGLSSIPSADVHSACFTGSFGAKETRCVLALKSNIVTVQSDAPLLPYEGMTIVVGWPKGLVATLEPKELVPFFQTPEGKATLIGLGILAVLWYIFLPIRIIWRWWKFGRDPKSPIGVAKAWFSPPTTQSHRALTPGETGALVDESVDMRDIYATIVDLARRGYIKIVEKKKEEFDLLKLAKSTEDLVQYETILLDGIFEDGEKVSVQDVDLQSTVEKVKKTVYESLVSEGFFEENPQTIRTKYYVLALFAFLTFNPVLLLIALTFGYHMPRKTLYGAQAASVAFALKKFLTSQEKKLTFQADKQMMFEKLLPYAIAFGVEEVWAKRFKDFGLSNPDWYVAKSGSHFNSVVFAHSLGHGMSVSFSASITHHSSRGFSSGFSSGGGGGSSGGGGGGGGGGSW